MITRITGEKSKISSKEKGITLIALVVTIIVLLILAGVSIQMLTGQNGILKRAQEAGEKTKRAEVIEEVQMEIYDKQVAREGKISHKELHDILDEYFENVPELEKNGTWKGFPSNFKEPLVSKEDKKIEVEIGEIYKGTIETVIKAEEVVKDLKEYIGAYVNYGINLDEDIETPDWRIFYAQNLNGENRVYLIAADYVPTDNEALIDAMGEGIGNSMMKPADSEEKRNLNVTWANSLPSDLQLITLESWKNIFKDGSYALNGSYENSRCVARLRETENWKAFKAKGGDYIIGGPTAHMWCDAWNKIVRGDSESEYDDDFVQITVDTVNLNGYYYSATEKGYNNKTAMYINGQDTAVLSAEQRELLGTESENNIYKLFFPHTTCLGITANGKTGDCYGYWLASPSACYPDRMMFVRYDGLVGDNFYSNNYAVRPVVCLTSNVKFTETGDIKTGKPVYKIK